MSELMEEYCRNRFAAEVAAMQNVFDQKVEQRARLIAQQTERAEQQALLAAQQTQRAEQQALLAAQQTQRAEQAEKKLAFYMLQFGKSVEEAAEIAGLSIEMVQSIAAESGEFV